MALNALFESRRSYGLISVAGRMGPTVEGEHAADRSGGVGLRILKGSRSPRGKWSGQRWDESDHALRLARRKLTTTSATFLFPEIRQRAAAIVSDTPCCAAQSVQTRSRVIPLRIGGGALCRAQVCLGTRKSARGREAAHVLDGAASSLNAARQAFRAGINTLTGLRPR